MADDCERCHHPFDPHLMLATTGQPMDGGIMICPVAGCACLGTWSTNGKPPRAPAEDQLRELFDRKDGRKFDVAGAIEMLKANAASR